MSFIGGIQLIVMGITALYIGRIYDEVKERPIYLLRQTLGFDRFSPVSAPLPNTLTKLH